MSDVKLFINDFFGFFPLCHSDFFDHFSENPVEGIEIVPTYGGWNIYFDAKWHDEVNKGKKFDDFLYSLERFKVRVRKTR